MSDSTKSVGPFTFLADQNLIINKAPASSVNHSAISSVHPRSLKSSHSSVQHNVTSDESSRPFNVYKVAQNIGYAALLKNGEQQIVFKCFKPGCSSAMMGSEDLFRHHMTAEHENAEWNGYCISCRMDKVSYERRPNIHDELQHLKEAHIVGEELATKDQPQPEITVAAVADEMMPSSDDDEESATVTDLDEDPTWSDDGMRSVESDDREIDGTARPSRNKTASRTLQGVHEKLQKFDDPKKSDKLYEEVAADAELTVVIERLKIDTLPVAEEIDTAGLPSELEDPKNSNKLNKENASDKKYQPRVVIERVKIDFLPSDGEEMPMTSEASASLQSKVVGSALLRPWMKVPNSKSDAIVKRMLQDDCLKANFKCMEHKCAFFTSDSNLFAQHINAHFEDGQAEGHNQCSYCEFISKDSLSLVEHVSIDHWDNVQCNGCFFRCQMKEIARIHVLQCHHDTPRNSKFIEVTPSPYLSWASIKQMVSPLFCSDCNEKFYLVRGFKGHINTCTKYRVKIGRCVKCGADVCKKDTFDHLESCYEVGMFHCLYCRFGTNGIEKLQSHITSSHPGELQFYCIRRSVELVADPKCYNTMIIAMMKSSHGPMKC